MCLINLFHLLFMCMNNSNGKSKSLTQDFLLGPLSPGLICHELLFLQMRHRYLRTDFPPVTETFVRTSLSAWAAFPWPVPHRCSYANLSWHYQKSKWDFQDRNRGLPTLLLSFPLPTATAFRSTHCFTYPPQGSRQVYEVPLESPRAQWSGSTLAKS